ncbi:MAG: thiamine pyrophosphate-dependent enzyme [Candidatus Aminicenantes bacterium]|nr:thiamine pyrophosphate-dependent enzyme [Candidatus Aminicenantes bacterium]
MTKADLIAFERRIAAKYDDGELPYLVHFCGGNEDQLIEIFKDIKPDDYVFSTHRNAYHALLHGIPPDELEAKIMAGRSMFVFDRARNFFSSSIVAATHAIAAGVAWALKRRGSKKRVWCFVGDGAEDEGHFYEAARYVDGWDLPCTFIIEDNDRNVNATKRERRGDTEYGFLWPSCVDRYWYKPTYPHGGTGTLGWLQFKREAQVVIPPDRQDSTLPELLPDPIKYMDAVKYSMEMLAREGAIFIGYNVRYGSAYGSLKNIPEDQRLETPLAENLMAGLGMGMSLEGFRPVVFFERHEFIMNAMDAIVNTLDVIETISDGEFHMPVIIKAVAGSVKPFYAGYTHTHNYADEIRRFVHFPVYEPQTGPEVLAAYALAREAKGPVMVSEMKALY